VTVLFIDESKSRRYLFAVTVVEEPALGKLRKQLRDLVMPGQRCVHFSGESDSRRRKILSQIDHLGLRARIFESGLSYELSARGHCFEQVIDFAAEVEATRIVIERDDSLFSFDERCLKEILKNRNLLGVIGFEHSYKHEDPLLWPSDAIAWCQNRGGDWAKSAAGLIYKD